MLKTVAVIQARMGSTRLPGKVLRELQGRSVLGHVVVRARACSRVDEVVVAVPATASDEPLADEARRLGARVHRGSEADVLDRYYRAAIEAEADWVVRLTSDCPLLDPTLICEMLEHFGAARQEAAPVDYLSNTLERTYPRGLDVEVFTFEALRRAWREADEPHEREHVTPYIYNHPDRFRLASHTAEIDLSHHRWTLDTGEDWSLIESVYASLGAGGAAFSTEQVLRLLESRPELVELNRHVRQKATGG